MECNRLISSLLLFITTIGFSQNIDWVNAPLNPLPKGISLDKTQLIGDVFQAGFTFYDEHGNWMDLENRMHITKDHLNRTIAITYADGKILKCRYDAAGNLIYDEGRVYEYDTQNRIIKAIYGYGYFEYSNQKQDDYLMVTSIEKNKTDEFKNKQIEIYKKGLLVARYAKTDSEKTLFKYQYDTQGNWIERTETDANGKTINQPFKRSIIYHSEYKDFDNNAEVRKTTGDYNLKGGIATPHLYINGKLDNTGLYNKFGNDYVFFNPLTMTYYLATNAYDKAQYYNAKILFKPLLQADNILLSDGNTALCVEKGTSTLFSNRKWKYESVYQNIVARDINGTDVYVAENALDNTTKETKAYPIISMTSQGNEVWYVPSEDKNYTKLYVKGILTKGYGIAGYIEGTNDFVLTINSEPTYVLSNFSRSKPKRFNKGRYFNPATDKISTSKTSNQTTNTPSTDRCISGDCNNGYGTYVFKNGTKAVGFFNNNKLNGYAECTYANGDDYGGQFVDGQRSGFGIYKWKQSNTQYYGHWYNGKQHGYGYLVKNNKTTQGGIYENNMLKTNLLTDFLNKKIQSTACMGDCINGYGAIKYNQGDSYVGFFKNGKPYKAGGYKWVNKNYYVGDWDSEGKINYSGMFMTDTYVYSGAFAHNGRITGLGVKTNKTTYAQSYGQFKDGNLVIDYANGFVLKPNRTNASELFERTKQSLAQLYVSTFKVNKTKFKQKVVNRHNSFMKDLPLDKVNQEHVLFIKRLFLLDKMVAHQYLLALPNPYARQNTGNLLKALTSEELAYFRAESRRITSQYKLKKEYEPKQ